jgi:Acetyltransferase (GNAT) domain
MRAGQIDPRPLTILKRMARRGYLHPAYAGSLSEFGTPEVLPRSQGWLLTRAIPNSDLRDALAGYRHLCCADWSALGHDLDEVTGLVSITAVTDPLADVELSYLSRCFPDLARQYKDNFVIDLLRPATSRHHREEIRKALRVVETAVDMRPIEYLDDWEELYDGLRRQLGLTGLPAFSRASFEKQLGVPGCVTFRALAEGRCVSMSVWYVMDEAAHYHLAASNRLGYSVSASYALVQAAIETFATMGLRWLNLGAGPRADGQGPDGLVHFKRGWATGVRPSYLCGRVYDGEAYETLARATLPARADYFPAYRRGEFG